MKLEDQVCSLELAQKLKAMGVKQESHFYWVNRRGDGACLVCEEESMNWANPEMWSAFTVAELGEMIPTRYLRRVAGPEARERAEMLIGILEKEEEYCTKPNVAHP